MSPLTNALERILEVWKHHGNLEAVSNLQSGLSDTDIEEIIRNLPFQLPLEVRELYQWRNGSKDDEGWYLSLQSAVAIYLDNLESYESLGMPEYFGRQSSKCFQIFPHDFESGQMGYLVIEENQNTCPVIFEGIKTDGDIIKKYASLTSMMLTIAECLEAGVYKRDERYQVWRKYNISIVEKALSKLQNNLSLKSLSEISVDLMMFKDSRAVEPLIQALEIPLPLADPYESIGIQKLAAEILGELDDSRAVKPLIRALQNPHQSVRRQAVISLRNLRDERAVEPLIKALGDSEKDVSSKAAVSLAYLKAVDQLIQALKHNDGYVRMLAVRSLGDIKDPKALEPLSQLTEDSDPNVRKTAIIALKKIRQKY